MSGVEAGMLAEAEPAGASEPDVASPPAGLEPLAPAPPPSPRAKDAGEATAVGGTVALALPRLGLASGMADGLAGLRAQARLARAQLGDQPLAIANQSSRLVMKLLGG